MLQNLQKPMRCCRALRAALVAALCLVAAVARAQTADRVVPTDSVRTRVVVRAEPTAQSADLGSLRPGQTAELLGSVPNWYRVRLTNGVEGFVSKRWTRLTSAPAPAAGPSFTVDVVDVGTAWASRSAAPTSPWSMTPVRTTTRPSARTTACWRSSRRWRPA